MRLLFLSLLICAVRLVAAQTGEINYQPAPDYEQQVGQILAPLDLSQVPGGYLHDKAGLPPIVEQFDGGALDSSNVMYTGVYDITLSALRAMSVSNSNPKLPDPLIWQQAMATANADDPIAISLAALTYGRMREDAI